MHSKFLKFFALVILIIGSFFFGKNIVQATSLSTDQDLILPGGVIKVLWRDIPNPNPNDYISWGPRNSPRYSSDPWGYVNAVPSEFCSHTKTSALTSGNCKFTIPSTTVLGEYKFRYVHYIGSNIDPSVPPVLSEWTELATKDFTIGGKITVNCNNSASICGGSLAKVFVPEGGCPSGNEDCGKGYKQDKTISSGSTSVTLTNIPSGVYRVMLLKDGYTSDPAKYDDVVVNNTQSINSFDFTLKVDTSKINSFKSTPNAIDSGGSSTLSWTTQDFTVCSINNGVGSIPNNGQKVVKPTTTTTYTLSCYNAVGTKKTATATVTVGGTGTGGGGGGDDGGDVAVTSFKVTPSNIVSGGSATLSWETKNATSCAIDQGIGNVNKNDTKTVKPTISTIYTLRCEGMTRGRAGWSTAQTTITVTGAGTGLGGGASCSASDIVPLKLEDKPDKYHFGFNTLLGIGGNGMNRRYVVSKSYGFLTYNLADLNNPVFYFETNSLNNTGGGPFEADAGSSHGGTMFSGMAISKDGTRLISQDDDYYGMYVYRNLGNEWMPSLVGNGEMRSIRAQIVKRSDGKYLALVNQMGWLHVMDVSDDKISNAILKDPREDNPPIQSNYYSLFPVASSNDDGGGANSAFFASGNYVLDQVRDYIRIFDVSKPLGNPDISSNITVQKLKVSDFGVDSSKYIFGNFTVTGSVDGNPAHIYVFARFYEKTSNVWGYELSQKGGVVELLNGVVKKTWTLSFPAIYSGVGYAENPGQHNKAYVSAIGPRAFFLVRSGSQNIFLNFTINESTKNLTSGIITIKNPSELWGGINNYDLVEENNTVYIFMSNLFNYWTKAPCTTVADTNNVKITNFKATPAIIGSGAESVLSWTTQNANTCKIDQEIGDVGLNNETKTVKPTSTTRYTLTCLGSGTPTATCTAPNCASAMRVVTVRREGGGGTGGGGADDGTGGRNLFWWLKYYLNL